MRIKAVAPDAIWVHCSIYREALATKGKSDCLKDVLDTTVKMVTYRSALVIKGQSIDMLFLIERRA